MKFWIAKRPGVAYAGKIYASQVLPKKPDFEIDDGTNIEYLLRVPPEQEVWQLYRRFSSQIKFEFSGSFYTMDGFNDFCCRLGLPDDLKMYIILKHNKLP